MCASHACHCLPAAVCLLLPCVPILPPPSPSPQAVSKPVSSSSGVSTTRVAPLEDGLVDPWADARTHLAGGSPDVSDSVCCGVGGGALRQAAGCVCDAATDPSDARTHLAGGSPDVSGDGGGDERGGMQRWLCT
jgi:hypothetical protein